MISQCLADQLSRYFAQPCPIIVNHLYLLLIKEVNMIDPNPNNSCKTKKKFTGSYTEVNSKIASIWSKLPSAACWSREKKERKL